MSQTVPVILTGLWTDPNQFSKVPPGSFTVADNMSVDRPGQIESRRGFNIYGSLGFVGTVRSLLYYQNTILAHGSNGSIYRDANHDGSSWPAYTGSFLAPLTSGSSRIRSTQARKNLYYTTRTGVYKLDIVTGTPRLAGAPVALGGSGTTTGATGFLPNTEQVAYRVVWGYRDANGYQVSGAPSDRFIVVNTSGGARNVSLTFLIPKNFAIDGTWFYQVYRSANSPGAVEPDDELQLVIEGSPTAPELAAMSVTSVDSTPPELRQATIYTAESQEGIAAANYPPPFADDIATYNGFTFYANTSEPHTLTLDLESTDVPDGLQIGDTLTFTPATGAPFTISAQAAENAALGQFQRFTAGTPSENIRNTAQSLVRVLNSYASNTFLAGYYVSTFDGVPGQMRFTRLDNTDNRFQINSSRNTCWTQNIPAAGTNFYNVSQNDAATNRLMYSKQDLPEAVPLTNTLSAGSSDSRIVRILLVKNYLYVLTTDGVYRVSGTTPSDFRVTTVDTTTRITAPNSAVTLENKLYFYSSLGIVSFDESALDIMEPISSEVLQLAANKQTPFQDNAFGISYESDKKYLLACPSIADVSPDPTQEYVWNYATQAWTHWSVAMTAGAVNPTDNKLYVANTNLASQAVIYKERKNYTDTDFADTDIPINIVSSVGDTIVLTSAVGLTSRMSVIQGTSSSIIESVDIPTNTIVLTDIFTWVPGAAIAVTPIRVMLTTIPNAQSNPGVLKETCELSLLFRTTGFDELTLTISTDLTGNGTPFRVIPSRFGAWGQFPWGEAQWGGNTSGENRIRVLLPTNTRRANWFTWTLEGEKCFSSFAMQGYSMIWSEMSSKQKG
jgi:hypothetical protein